MDTRGWIVLANPSAEYDREVQTVDDQGNPTTETVKDFGQPQWAYRRPGDHLAVYSGVSADDDPPRQSAQEHLEASDYEPPQPDSVVAANEVAAAERGSAQPQAQAQAQPTAQA